MRRTTTAAVGFAALDLALVAAMLAFSLAPIRPGVPNGDPAAFIVALVVVFFVTTPVVAGLIAARQPRNPIGWLFLSVPFWFELGFAADAIGRRLAPSDALGLFVTLGSDLGGLGAATLFLILALFPTGRLPGPRWRVVLALIAIGSGLNVVTGLFTPAVITPPIPGLPLPLARPDAQPLLDAAGTLASFCLFGALVGVLALLAVRFRRSSGVEREQLKWFLWAASINTSILLFGLAITPLSDAIGNAAWIGFLASLVLLPIAAAVAMLRYRLYDVDVLINRTIVYLAVSGVLALVYATSVLVLSQLLEPVTHTSAFAVAASTLAAAGLFTPVRNTIQRAVDRRFYRRRYDAAVEIGGFAAGLRGEVDVERVEHRLVATVERTMEPAFAAVWLRRSDALEPTEAAR